MATRIEQGVERGREITLKVDGETVSARDGETLAAVLLLQRKAAFYTTRSGRNRTPFCNMGSCFECRTQLDFKGRQSWVLACITPVEEGMSITTGLPLPQLPETWDAG